MKTTLILSALLFPILLWGQAINHFDNADSKWNVAKTYPAANAENPSFAATTTTVYGFQGDTLIDSVQWFKIYSSDDPLFQSNLEYRGLTRSENNKVFFMDTANQLDTLYDFSLNVGDSAEFDLYGMYPEWLQVVEVGSIELEGNFYKKITFAEPSINAFDELNEVWIEGIGSIHGPLFPNYPVKFSEEVPDSMLLTCSYSDGEDVWQHPSFTSCYVNIVLGVENLETRGFKVYPNPFSDIIHFENPGIGKCNLTILNALGQVVRKVQVDSKHSTIELRNLKAGIYFIRIDDGDETIRVVKEK